MPEYDDNEEIEINPDAVPPLPPLSSANQDLPFIHKSYVPAKVSVRGQAELLCNKPAECLGDAAFYYHASMQLSRLRWPMQPAVLSLVRAHLVSNCVFAKLALQYKFQDRILLDPGSAGLGLNMDQKVLADTLEAYVGVLCLDILSASDAAQRAERQAALDAFFEQLYSTAVFPNLVEVVDRMVDARTQTAPRLDKRPRSAKRCKRGSKEAEVLTA